MANELKEMSLRQIRTKLNQLMTLMPALQDNNQPTGQLWSDICQEFQLLTQDLEHQEELIDQRIEQVVTLHDISSRLGSYLDLEGLLTHLAEYSAQLMAADVGIIRLRGEGQPDLTIRATHFGPAAQAVAESQMLTAGQQIVDHVAATQQAVLANNWPNHPVAATQPSPTGNLSQVSGAVLAILAVPIILQHQVIGLIEVQSLAKTQAFTENDLHLLSLLADHAASAIKNTQLYQQAENNYRFLKTVIEHIPDPIFIKDQHHTLIEMNQANAAIIGRPEEELLGKSDHDLFPPELAEKFRRRDDEAFASKELLIAEDKTIWADGQEHIGYTRLVPMPDSAGQPAYLLGITHDVTERKAREAERERLLAETVALYQGSQAIARAISERQIFEALFEQIRLQNPCEIAAFRFHLVNDEPIWAELITSWHKQNSPTYLDKNRIYLPEYAQARLLTSTEPIFIDDIASDNRLSAAERASFEPTSARSTALLPLVATGYRFGMVLVYFTRAFIFTEMVQRLWLALMDQVSISLLNLEFIQKSAYRAIQMDTAAEVARVASSILKLQELLDTAVGLIRDRFELYYVGVFLVDEAREWAVLRAGSGEAGRIQLERGHRLKIGGESMIGWAVANRQARIALDVGKDAVHFQNPYLPETRSEMALPLIHRNEVIGALTIQSTEQAAFSREDIIFLRTMADQLAVAIDNARLFSQVQKSEATNRALLDAIPDLMFRISRSGTYLDVRGSTEVSTVIPQTEFIGKTLFDVLPVEVAQERLHYIEKTLKTGELQTFEYELTIAGQRHYFEARLAPSGADEVLSIIRDITERRESEKVQEAIYRISEAAQSAPNLQELFKTIHDIVCELTHTDNFYIALYDDATDLLDFTYFVDQQDDLTDRRPGKGLTAYVLKTGQPLLATPQVYADLISRGEVEPLGPPAVDWLGVPLTIGHKIIGVLAVQTYTEAVRLSDRHKDILAFVSAQVAMAIERKRAEEALQVSEAKYRELVENANSIIFRMNMRGEVTFFNEFAQRFFGYTEEEIMGRNVVGTIVPQTENLAALIQDIISYPDQYAANENENMRRDGERVWVAWTNKAIIDESGQVTGILCVGNDVTAHKQVQEALTRREQYMEALVEIQTQLLAYYKVEDYYPRILEILGRVSEASRIYIFENDDDTAGQLLMSQRSEWCASGIKSEIDNPARQHLPYAESFPRWAELLTQGKIITGPVSEFPAAERAALESRGVQSILILPLIVNGEFFGFIGFDDCEETEPWEQAEIDLLQMAAAAVSRWHERRLAREELARERNLLRTLIDNLPDYIYAKDKEGRFLLANQSLARLYNATSYEELLGKTDFDFYPPELASQYAADEQAIIASGQALIGHEEPNLDQTTGEQAWTSTTKVPLRDNQGRITGLVGVSHNITARKRAEASLQEALRRSQLLYNISEALTAMTDRQAVLETVLGEYLLLLKIDRGRVTLFDPASGYNKVEAMYLDHRVVKPDYAIPAAEDLLADYLTKNPFPLLIENAPSHPLTKPARQIPGPVEAMLLIPLISRGEVIGAMSAEATDPNHRFSKEDMDAGKAIADQLAIWLENRQLFEQAQHRSNLLATGAEVSGAASSILDPDALITTSVNLIRNQFDFYYVGLFLVDEARKWAVLRAGTGEAGRLQVEKGHRLEIGGESMIGWAVANRRARIALDVGKDAVHFQNPYLPDTRSEMALPLISRDEVIGALTVQSMVQNAFSEEDITVLQTMADQLANAIANARLFEHVRQSQQAAEALLQETQALQQLSQALAGTLETEEILDLFFNACTQDIGFEYVMLSLVDQAKNEVKAMAGVGVSASHVKRACHSLDSTDIMADIVRTGKTEVLTGWDERFDPALYEDEGHADWIRLFTPIILRRENVGLVEAGFNKNRRDYINDAQIRLLRAFIDQTALALDNAHRYEASQRAARREALIKEITTKVRASTDLDKILQTTVKEIGEAMGGKRAYVQLISQANGETKTDQ